MADPADLGQGNGSTDNHRESCECFNLPAVDIRTTAQWCYFDIELPGVTDKVSINIHWISSQSFIVEGEIPRSRIDEGDELIDDSTSGDWDDVAIGSTDLSSDSVGIARIPMRKRNNTLNGESMAANGESTPGTNDKYPGFPHLVRCPGSNESNGSAYLMKRISESSPALETNESQVQNSTFIEDEFSPTTTRFGRPHPKDEIELMHSRSNSYRSFSNSHKPHNDRDVQPRSIFSFLSESKKQQSPDQAQETPFGDTPPDVHSHESRHFSEILRPVANIDEPHLVLAERMIGSYKRRCTIPKDLELFINRTEMRLEAGVLTVRILRNRETQENGNEV